MPAGTRPPAFLLREVCVIKTFTMWEGKAPNDSRLLSSTDIPGASL